MIIHSQTKSIGKKTTCGLIRIPKGEKLNPSYNGSDKKVTCMKCIKILRNLGYL